MGRRGNGEGTITLRRDGRWEAKITVDMRGTKPVRKSYYCRTRADAAAKLVAVKRDLQRGIAVQTDERTTVDAYLGSWLAGVQNRVRPRTYELYAGVVRNHLVPSIGGRKLTKLSPQDVQRMLNELQRKGLAPRTVRTIRSVLRQALEQAARWGDVPRNVASLVDLPKLPQYEFQPFSLEEARRFLDAIETHRTKAVFVTLLLTGARRGEVLALRWEDVDLESGTIRITGNLQRVAGELRRAEPKTASSRRTLALPNLVVDALKVHRIRQVEERLQAGGAWQESGYVFTTSVGTPIEPRNLLRTFSRLLSEAGLRKVRLHDLRHCFASLQLAEGTAARVVMEQLGHTQISTTLGIYSHVTDSLHRESAKRIDALFAS